MVFWQEKKLNSVAKSTPTVHCVTTNKVRMQLETFWAEGVGFNCLGTSVMLKRTTLNNLSVCFCFNFCCWWNNRYPCWIIIIPLLKGRFIHCKEVTNWRSEVYDMVSEHLEKGALFCLGAWRYRIHIFWTQNHDWLDVFICAESLVCAVCWMYQLRH